MDDALRSAARRSVEEDRAHPEAVVSALFARDWLLTLAGLVDARE